MVPSGGPQGCWVQTLGGWMDGCCRHQLATSRSHHKAQIPWALSFSEIKSSISFILTLSSNRALDKDSAALKLGNLVCTRNQNICRVLSVCIYRMCVCVWVAHVIVCVLGGFLMHMYACVCRGRGRLNWRASLSALYPYQGLRLNLELTDCLSWLVSKPQGPACLCLPINGTLRALQPHLDFYVGAGA